MGSSYLRYALAMRERLPQVGKVFEAGDIDYRLFQTIVFRTTLITDTATLASIDAQVAALAPRWPSMTRGKLAAAIDELVARLDPDAVRRTRTPPPTATSRSANPIPAWAKSTPGCSTPPGSRSASASTNWPPPSVQPTRATTTNAAPTRSPPWLPEPTGWPAPAAATPAPPGPTPGRRAPSSIHVVAEQATLEGRSQTPGYAVGSDSLILAQMLRELAAAAKCLPIIPPVGATPEPGYIPSRALAEFAAAAT